MELFKLTINEAKDLLRKKEISARELTSSAIEQAEKMEKDIRAFITLDFEGALKQAELVDKALAEDKELPDLAGIPMGLKDNICTEGMATTCASKMLENFKPPYSATVVNKLLDSMGVLLGKNNMDEFAIGSSGESSTHAITRNPWDINRVPGGSSSGSAASVAADEVFFSLGSDTGGSIRQPASFCGVVGIKPTYGLISRYGLIPFASSLDQIGPLTKNITDCAIVLNAITGHDPKDSTSAKFELPDYKSFLKDNAAGLRIGVPKEYFTGSINEDVKAAVDKAIGMYEEMGAYVDEISMPHFEYGVPAYFLISSAEVSSNMAMYDGIRFGYHPDDFPDLTDLYLKVRTEGFGPNVKKRILLGNYALSEKNYENCYLKALKVRTLIKEDFDRVFKDFDIVLSPTNTNTAFGFEETYSIVETYEMDKYTVPANLAGLPALSFPCGFDTNGLPIGLQLTGKAFDEGTLLRAAFTFEQNTDFHIRRPAINWR